MSNPINNPNIDIEEFKRQEKTLIEYLSHHETGKGKFIVLDNEAGFSKSRITDRTIVWQSKKYLLVKRYNNEQYQSLKNMKDSIDWLVDIVGEKQVLVINAGNSYDYENNGSNKAELLNAQIIIISHEKYRLLSKSDKLYLYIKGRHTLIIDEYVDIPIITMTKRRFQQLSALFPIGLGAEEYNVIHRYFIDKMQELDYNKVDNIGNLLLLKIIDDDQDNSKLLLNKLREMELFYKPNVKIFLENTKEITLDGYPISQLTYIKVFKELESIIRNQVIYNKHRKYYSTYRDFDFWTLDNNIILDASGSILTQYQINPLFNVIPQPKVFNYKGTTIYIKEFKSYRSIIERYFDPNKEKSAELYFSKISEYITNNTLVFDKALVVSHKDDEKYFKQLIDQNRIYFTWHGNILGKNDWRDCGTLFINTTFNLPDDAYILTYSFYANVEITKEDLGIISGRQGRVLNNSTIEQLKQNFILHNYYQTIKRINRDLEKDAYIYIITDNIYFIDNISKLLFNVNLSSDYNIDLPNKIKNEISVRIDTKYKNIEVELIRMQDADKGNLEEFEKSLFCKNTFIGLKRLKETLYHTATYRDLCENYQLDLERTFHNSRVKRFIFK